MNHVDVYSEKIGKTLMRICRFSGFNMHFC